MICENCGCEVKDNQKFCPKCGAPNQKLKESSDIMNRTVVQPILPETDKSNGKKKKAKMPKSKKITIIIVSVIAVLAVIAASVAAFFFTSPAYKVYKNLKNGNCEKAVEIYETKVENNFIQENLFEIIIDDYEDKVVRDFKNDKIDYDEAMAILNAMKGMDIDDIPELIDEINRLSGNSQKNKPSKGDDAQVPESTAQDGSAGTVNYNFKVGFIYLHDENSTYDLNFMQAAKAACQKYGVTYVEKTNVPESRDCYDAAEELVSMGCKLIFADSYGHESYLLEAAKKYPDVQFCHAAGVQAHTAGVSNFHNAYAKTYEGRYICGVAAGMKLNDMITMDEIRAEDAKLGYVGAFEYAECISDYTAFYLGAKSVCPTVKMDVKFVNSWYNVQVEKEAAEELIGRGCQVISQHSDSLGAPSACDEAGVPNIPYNPNSTDPYSDSCLISFSVNWQTYFEYIIECVAGGRSIATDWCGGIKEGSVEIGGLNARIAGTDTDVMINKIKSDIVNGNEKVFETDNFTVGGKKLTSYMSDVDFDANYSADTEIVKDGYVHEGEYRSAPCFDIHIDGITLLNEAF